MFIKSKLMVLKLHLLRYLKLFIPKSLNTVKFIDFKSVALNISCIIYKFFTFIAMYITNSISKIEFKNIIHTIRNFDMKDLKRVRHSYITLASFAIIIFSISASNVGFALKTSVNGKNVGYVTNKAEIDSAVVGVEETASKVLGRNYSFNKDISVSLSIVNKENYLSQSEIKNIITDNVDEVSTLAIITVNGETIGAVETISEAHAILDSIKDTAKEKVLLLAEENASNLKAEISFAQDVKIEYGDNATALKMTSDELKNKLIVPENITVKLTDNLTLDNILTKNNLTTKALINLNPGIEINSLSIGDEIVIAKKTKLVTTKATLTQTVLQDLPYGTTSTENNDKPKNFKSTIKQGIAGVSKVTKETTYLNDIEQSATLLDKVTLTNPTNEIIEVGTLDYSFATGDMIIPFSKGRISSDYGYRGKEFHTGVDFAGPTGSNILASDNGTVIFAGWKGNYGKCVIIDHGNGLQTLYAHNSLISVSVGDVVAKGTTIAKLGSTGRSTGPHCHFEILENGDNVSPWKYV